MKIIITESQLKNIIQKELEEDYPINWNVEDFKKLNSFNKRIQYCEEKLTRISSGSSRIVYKIDESKVLKLAKNQKGIAQNEAEIDFSNDYMWDGITAEIFNHDENSLWVEMELARKVTPTIWMNIVGIPLNDMMDCVRYMENQKTGPYSKRQPPPMLDDAYENEFTSTILDLIGNYDIPSGDFGKYSTYGVVNRKGEDDIVIIDYGLTTDVMNKHYIKNKKDE
jgi:hypothetical protein